MEFDEHEEQEEEEEEEEEEEMGYPVSPVAGYDSLGNSAKIASGEGGADGGATTTPTGRKSGPTGTTTVRYRECQKNHAVSIGGHAVDGCCEFLAAGEEGTMEAVICAACNCHRNFHRKEIDGEIATYHRHQPQPQPQPAAHPQYHHHQQFSPYYHRSAPPAAAGYLHHHHHLVTPPVSQHRPLALPAAASGGGFSREEDDMSNPSSSGGGGGGSGTKKRHRTKFTQEQKDKMLEFAERVGWRLQKTDEAAVEQFCAETCLKRNVLKVWMHNNKNTLGKKP